MSNFNLDRIDRTQVFIDAPNLLASMKVMGGRKIDWSSLRSFFDEYSRLVRMNYYATVRSDSGTGARGLLDWMSYNGFEVIEKEVLITVDPVTEVTKVRGGVLVEMALDIVDAANHCDHIVIFSGDGELLPAILRAKQRGAKVTVVASRDSTSNDHIRNADGFYDLIDLPIGVWKDEASNDDAASARKAARRTRPVPAAA